jgi:single-stranded DNA-binding protein
VQYGHINFVHLIGEVCALPQAIQNEKGKKSIRIFIETKEPSLDSKGKLRYTKNKHQLLAWGKWHQVIDEFIQIGHEIAIEGRLQTRCYRKNGQFHYYSEIEINDLTIL